MGGTTRASRAGEMRARHGNVLGLTHVSRWIDAPAGISASPDAPVRYRVLDASGDLLAVAEATPAGLQPFIVLASQG